MLACVLFAIGPTLGRGNVVSVSLESITAKLRATRAVFNVRGEPIELTHKHRSVVRYICLHGYTYKEIARDTGESLHVIKHVVSQTLRLSQCKNQGQLGAWAQRQGLV